MKKKDLSDPKVFAEACERLAMISRVLSDNMRCEICYTKIEHLNELGEYCNTCTKSLYTVQEETGMTVEKIMEIMRKEDIPLEKVKNYAMEYV